MASSHRRIVASSNKRWRAFSNRYGGDVGIQTLINKSSDINNFNEIRDAVRDLCAQFPNEYFRKVDEARAYPAEFVDALTKAGWMAALIPQEYGGSGLGLTEASVIMEEINRCGGNLGACHGQM